MRRRHIRPLFAVLALLLPLAGCSSSGTGSAGATPPVPDVANGSVAAAKAYLHGEPPQEPGPFQRSLLAKASLTYADYESAMQAMAQCVQDRVPGMWVTLNPSQAEPGMFDMTAAYGAAPGSVHAIGPGSAASDGSTPSTQDSPEYTESASAGSGPVATEPASVVSQDRALGQCELTYSAYVEDRWQQELVLTASQETVQKPQFLACLTAAGAAVPSDTSDSTLKKWLQSTAWSQGLTAQQTEQANACVTKYADLVNTIGQ